MGAPTTIATEPQPRRAGVAARSRRYALGALGLAGFLGANAVLLAIPYQPYIEGYTDKLSFYERHQDRFTTLFVGSSRVFRHVDPAAVDAAARAAGAELASFNMGVDALSLIEMKALVEEIADRRPARLEMVFLEPAFGTHIARRNIATERAVHFHDWEASWLAIRCNLDQPRYRWTLWRNALAGLYHHINRGKLAGLLLPVGGVTGSRATAAELAGSLGFTAQDAAPSPEMLRWNEDLRARMDVYAAEMTAPRTSPGAAVDHHRAGNEAILEMARALERAGIRPVFLLTPGFHRIAAYLQFERFHRQEGVAAPLLSYLRPGGLEELYVPELWFDPGHMNGEGARRFSTRLGRDVARHLAAGGRP